MTFATHAPDLIARGFSVFPVKDKRPCVRWEPLQTTCVDETLLESWLKKYRNENVGIATGKVSGFFVLDIDGDEGEASLAEVEATYGKLPPTLTVKTGRGRHIYFAMPDGGDVRNSASKVAPRIDVRGSGGYVVGPGSVHKSGLIYHFIDECVPIADAPEWLLRLVINASGADDEEEVVESKSNRNGYHAPPTDLAAFVESQVERVRNAALGTRNDTLNKVALILGHYVPHYLAEARMRELLIEASYANSDIANDDDLKKAHSTISSGLKKGRAQPNTFTTSAGEEWFAAVPPVGALYERKAKLLGASFMQPMSDMPYSPDDDDIVSGLIGKRTINIFYGRTNVGKTFLGVRMAHAIASGVETLWGKHVEQTNVLYIALEGLGGFGKRVEAIRREFGMPLGLFVRTMPLDLFLDNDGALVDAMIEAIRENNIGLVFIDTLARTLTGAKENDASDMGTVLNRLGSVVAATGASFVAIGHPGKDEDKGFRGSSATPAAVDLILKIQNGSGGTMIARVEKARDSTTDVEFTYSLREIELGVNQRGEKVTTCIAEIDAVARVVRPTDGLKDDERKWFRAICQTIAKIDPEPSRQEGAKYSVAAVPRHTLGDMQFLLLRKGSATSGDMRATLSKSEQRRAQRMYERLKSRGKIGTNLTHVWVWRHEATDGDT